MLFSYRARDNSGLQVSGELESDSLESARTILSEQGLIPIKLIAGKETSLLSTLESLNQYVKPDELMLFTRQFYSLFRAGMDMETILSTLAKQSKNKFFTDTLLRIKGDVASGTSLAVAFSRHPKVFDKLYTSMLVTGEEAGILEEVLGQLSTLLEKEITLKASVKSSTLYPKIVIFVLIAAATLMMMFVIPKFVGFYANYKAELPLPTRILIGASNFLRGYFPMIVGGVGTAWFLFKRWASTTTGRLLVDEWTTKIPVFGAMGLLVANARFAHILGSLYRAGLPLTRALSITADVLGNEAFARDIKLIQSEVENGRGIAEAMRPSKYLNPVLIEATAIAEKTGAIDEMYKSIAEHFDMEVTHTLKNLTTLLEPILLFFIFGMITLFVLAIFLPMWNLSSVVLKK